MSEASALSALLLGFVLGLQHATDPDHLAAVVTIVSRERRFRDGALVGALWGLGHSVTLALAGGTVVLLGVGVGARAAAGLELVVAAMLVALGALRLADALRGASGEPREHLLADHDHGGAGTVHSHPHEHAGRMHAHPHVHPSRRLLAALAAGRPGLAWGAAAVGAVHGLAGTATMSLLVLATVRSPTGAVAYLAAFGLGTIAGMGAFTAVLAWPVSLALRFRLAHRALAVTSGVGAIALGLLYAARGI